MEALIGAVIGAAAALAGTWFSAKHSAQAQVNAATISTRAQMNAAVLSTLLPVRLDVYRQIETALEEWSGSMTHETCAAVYTASNLVSLVCGEETRDILAPLVGLIHESEESGSVISPREVQRLHLKLIHSMNQDLLHIQAPEIEESKEQSSRATQTNTMPHGTPGQSCQ